MIIKLIFITRKNKGVENQTKNSNPVDKMISGLFSKVKENTFSINVDDKTYNFDVTSTKKIDAGYFYKIAVSDYSPAINARIMNDVFDKITKGKHRKDYNIIASYDEASEYYCEKIYTKLNLFERKIRNLIFNILIEAFGLEWADKAISEEIKEELKKKKIDQNKLIEEALHEFTIFQIEKLLFEAYREVHLNQLIDTDLCIDKVKEMEKDEIIKVLSKGRPKSLWERYFKSKIEIENFQDKLSSIRTYRNNVAHNKRFTTSDYNLSRKLLRELISDLDRAIETTETGDITNVDFTSAIAAFAKTMESYQLISKMIGERLSEMMEVFNKIELPKIEFDMPKLNTHLLSLKLNPFDDE